MQQKITVPAYDIEAAQEARKILRKASAEAEVVIGRFGREYEQFAQHQAAALGVVGHLAEKIVHSGRSLECRVNIVPRGRIEIEVHPGGMLYSERNIGPYQSGPPQWVHTQSIARMMARIDYLLDRPIPPDGIEEKGLIVEPFTEINS